MIGTKLINIGSELRKENKLSMMDRDYIQEVKQLEVLDFSISLGRPKVPPQGFYAEAEDALAEMNRLGIKQGLVYHITARGYQSVYGNNRLLKEISDSKQLIASWVLVPSEDEMGCTPEHLVADLKKNNVKVVRLFPAAQSNPSGGTRYAFYKWLYGDFMEALEAARIPVAIDFSLHRRADPEWDKLYSLAKDFPKLPIVLCDQFQRATWTLVKLMKLLPNIYVQTSCIEIHRQLEYLVTKVGAERFIAGSKFPEAHMGTMLGHLLFTNLTQEHRKLIAGDNARRIMGMQD